MTRTGPSNVQASASEAWDTKSIEELWASHQVMVQLGINPSMQTKDILAFMNNDKNNPFVIASVCIAKKFGYYHFRIVKDNEPHGAEGFVFFIKVDSSKDVDKLNGHLWYSRNEFVDFRRMKKLSVLESYDNIERIRCRREVA
ncbi:unnamed protein product [Urochloa humidicola]